jgi:hypothetical protein
MPAAFYAISFKATASVLAFCSLEKQAPPDQAAWDKLRDGLVGDALPVGLPVTKALQLPSSSLAVDLIGGAPPSRVIVDPYAYQVSLVGGDAVPGDGKEKALKPAGGNTVSSIAVNKTTGVVTVTLDRLSAADVPAWLIFDDLEPIGATRVFNTIVTFQLPTTISVGSSADVVVLMKGVPTTYRSVTPSS